MWYHTTANLFLIFHIYIFMKSLKIRFLYLSFEICNKIFSHFVRSNKILTIQNICKYIKFEYLLKICNHRLSFIRLYAWLTKQIFTVIFYKWLIPQVCKYYSNKANIPYPPPSNFPHRPHSFNIWNYKNKVLQITCLFEGFFTVFHYYLLSLSLLL